MDMHEKDLQEVVSITPSVLVNTYSSGPKRSLLDRRLTSVNRVSIAENAPATLSFHDISYTIGATKQSNKNPSKPRSIPWCKSQPTKQVLSHVSGKFINGMNAILGKIRSTSLH